MSTSFRKVIHFCSVVLIGVISSTLEAKSAWSVDIQVGPDATRFTASNPVDLAKDLTTNSIERKIPIYTSTTAAFFDFNLRGIEAFGGFGAGSTTLSLVIPQLNINESFTGSTREESTLLFEEYLRTGGNGSHGFLKAFIELTPIDPVAGNPTSLLAEMAQAEYAMGRLSPLSGCNGCWSAQPIVHQFQSGVRGGRTFCKDFGTSVVTLPFRYSYSPRQLWALIVDGPVTITRMAGAWSYISSFGAALRIPLLQGWSITPSLRLGLGGSFDLATAGSFVSTGLLSHYDLTFGSYVLALTNYAGYYSSTHLELGGINFSHKLSNMIFKNGFSLTNCEPFYLCDRAFNYSLVFIDSDFEGSELFVNHYDEVAINLIVRRVNPFIDYDCLTLGLSCQFGQQGYQGYFLNLAYQF